MGRMVRATKPQRKQAKRQQVILVVEDEILVRSMVAEFLRTKGYAVIEAANAKEAISVITIEEKIDLIFSDVNMPGTNSMDGIGLAAWVSQHYPEIPIVLASGHSHAAHAAEMARAFLPKPYRMTDVICYISALLEDSKQDV